MMEASKNTKIYNIINIQRLFRGYCSRKQLIKLTDGMTFNTLNICIDNYIDTIANEKQINTVLNKKKIRLSNFPSHISENIAKFAIAKKYKIMPNWDIEKGDIVIDKLDKPIRCEIKGSINLSNGPPTFGPTEEWDYIYFVDGIENHNKIYKVYEIKLSNNSDIWKNIKISNQQTYYDQCLQKRRPRLAFKDIQSQLGKYCNVIFHGHISELDDTI